MRRVCGADGCRAGWYGVCKNLDSGEVTGQVYRGIYELVFRQSEPLMLAIDIPIGLPDAGARQCDRAARRILKPGRASSVFPAPIRPLLAAGSYQEACQIRLAVDGRKISKQLWQILPKIREIDDLLLQNVRLQTRLREVHPELSFTALNDGKPMAFWKKRPEGFAERLPLLKGHFGDAVEQALATRNPAECSPDDVLDAFAALWTAERIVRGEAQVLPEQPEKDRFGLRMEMVY